MIRTNLFKAVDRFADRLADEFAAAGLHDVVSPSVLRISVRSTLQAYRLAFDAVPAPRLRLRVRMEVGRDLDSGELARAAVETAEAVARARASRSDLLGMLRTAGRAARLGFAGSGLEGSSSLAGVQLAPVRVDRSSKPFAAEIAYDGLDDRLRCTRQAVQAADAAAAESALEAALRAQALRAANRRLAREGGGVGLVEGVALAAINAWSRDPAAFLARLAREHSVLLDTPCGRGSQQAVGWEDGVAGLRLRVSDELSLGRGGVRIRRTERDLDLACLRGAPLGALVEHPFLRDGIPIEGASWDDRWPRPIGSEHDDLLLAFTDRLHAFDLDGNVLN